MSTPEISETQFLAHPIGRRGTVGILVGGGPAPGINGVIAAVTIEARRLGYRVVGLRDGFRHLVEGRTDRVVDLRIDDVAAVMGRGGSILGTSRTDTGAPGAMDAILGALRHLGIRRLATIGGDGTVNTARQLEQAAGGDVAVAHVPKTIDNDLPLPGYTSTFGFQTARHEGVRILRSLMEETRTTERWSVVETMGREAGHLALGIGKAAGATVTLLGEEFTTGVPLSVVADVVEAAILKNRALGRRHGTIVLAEGIATRIAPGDLRIDVADLHRRLSDVPLSRIVKDVVLRRFADRGDDLGMIATTIGYELRCADPIPFDLEYTRDLGFGAMRFLDAGRSGAMMSIQGGKLVPIWFDDVLDPATGRTRVRTVNLQTEGYRVARQYMVRLEKADIDDPDRLAGIANAAGLEPAAFRERFGYLVEGGQHLRPIPELAP